MCKQKDDSKYHMSLSLFRALSHLLLSKTVPGASGKGNVIPVHSGVNVPEPAVWNKLLGLREYHGIRMHEIRGHPNRDLDAAQRLG